MINRSETTGVKPMYMNKKKLTVWAIGMVVLMGFFGSAAMATPSLEVTKQVDGGAGPFGSGSSVPFVITVTNTGDQYR